MHKFGLLKNLCSKVVFLALFVTVPSVNSWAEFAATNSAQALPNDPLLDQQTSVFGLNLPTLWNHQTGDDDVVVAVIDTGMNLHAEFLDNLWTNPGEIADDGIDNDGNGFIDDVHGWDFVSFGQDRDNDFSDPSGQGTHTAGVIGAQGNNALGITGMAWNVSLMPVRALYQNGPNSGDIGFRRDDVADAIRYAADNGADIINLGFAMRFGLETIQNAIDYAANKGCLLVAPAGNDGLWRPIFPAASPNVLAVAALRPDGSTKLNSSNVGLWVDLAVPGENIITTSKDGDDFEMVSDSNMAAATVSGLAALMKAENPNFKASTIRQRLMRNTVPVPAITEETRGLLGAGMVDASNILEKPPNQPDLRIIHVHMDDSPGNDNGEAELGETINVYVGIKNFGATRQVQVEVTSPNPWIEIIDGIADFKTIAFGKTKSNIGDQLLFRTLANAPLNSVAEFSVEMTFDGSSSSQTFSIPVNSQLSRGHRLFRFRNSKYDPEIAELDSETMIYAAAIDSNRQLRALVRNVNGEWIDDGSQTIAYVRGFKLATRSTEATIAYIGGPLPVQLHILTYDQPGNFWQPPVQITTNAVPLDVFSKPGLIYDQSGQTHLVWADRRNGFFQVFHTMFDGNSWTPEVDIFSDETITVESAGTSMQLFAEPDGDVRLFFGIRNDGSWERYTMTRTSDGWSDATDLTNFARSGPVMQTSTGYIMPTLVLSEHRIANFDGTDWVLGPLLTDDPDFGFDPLFVVGPNDELQAVGSDIDEITSGEFMDLWNGNSGVWSKNRLAKRPNSGLINIFSSFFIDSGGRSHLLSHESDSGDRGGEWEDLVLRTSLPFDNTLLPAKPVLINAGLYEGQEDILRFELPDENLIGVREIYYAVGTAPGLDDVLRWEREDGEPGYFMFFGGEPLPANQQIFISVQFQGDNLYWSPVSISDPILVFPGGEILSDGFDE